jgi:phosphoglycolate phosphatase
VNRATEAPREDDGGPQRLRYDPVLCDLDGTLVDSTPAITTSIRKACAAVGAPLDQDLDLSFCVGPPLVESFTQLLADGQLVTRALDAYRHSYVELAGQLNPPMPGVQEALRRLDRAGATLAVVTYKLTWVAEEVLGAVGLREFFRAVVGLRDDDDSRSKHELLREALDLVDVPRPRPLYVGDLPIDEAAARTAGISFARHGKLAWADLAGMILS